MRMCLIAGIIILILVIVIPVGKLCGIAGPSRASQHVRMSLFANTTCPISSCHEEISCLPLDTG